MLVRSFIATSLDGYIARPDGRIDWLDEFNQRLNGINEDGGYAEFIKGIDAIVLGRNTFETVLSFNIPWPYSKPVFVLSRNSAYQIPPTLCACATLTNLPPTQLVQWLFDQNLSRIYIDGGATVQSFLRDSLIDEITITTIPVAIGKGISLFGNLESDLHLQPIQRKEFPFGIMQTTYHVLKNVSKS